MPEKLKLLFFFFIQSLPPSLIFFGFIDYEYRYHIMAPVIIFTLFYAIYKRFDKISLGMKLDNFMAAAKWQILISVGLTIVAILLISNGLVRDLEPPQNPWFYVMYLFVSGPVQEFTYRSVPFAALDRHVEMPDWIKIGIVVLNFAWLHVIYFDWIIYGASLFMGLVWTSIYFYKRNFWAVSIAHAICGFCAIWFGLI